jgi:hypothetical protein
MMPNFKSATSGASLAVTAPAVGEVTSSGVFAVLAGVAEVDSPQPLSALSIPAPTSPDDAAKKRRRESDATPPWTPLTRGVETSLAGNDNFDDVFGSSDIKLGLLK